MRGVEADGRFFSKCHGVPLFFFYMDPRIRGTSRDLGPIYNPLNGAYWLPKAPVWTCLHCVGHLSLAYSRHCAAIQTLVQGNFFFYVDPSTNDGGPKPYLQVSKISPTRPS